MPAALSRLIRDHIRGTLAEEYLEKQGCADLLDGIAQRAARQVDQEVGTLELLARRLVQGYGPIGNTSRVNVPDEDSD